MKAFTAILVCLAFAIAMLPRDVVWAHGEMTSISADVSDEHPPAGDDEAPCELDDEVEDDVAYDAHSQWHNLLATRLLPRWSPITRAPDPPPEMPFRPPISIA